MSINWLYLCFLRVEGKKSESPIRQSRMKPFRRKNPVSGLRNPAEEGLTKSDAEQKLRSTEHFANPAS